MNTATKLGAYGLVLAAALGGGAAIGGAAGPIEVDDAPAHDQHDPASTPDSGRASPDVGGLAVSDAGYRFVPEDRLADAGEFAFTIEGPDGSPATAFDVEHDKRLHLVVASRDLRDYAHLHPNMDASGRWTVDLPELTPGAYRAFADFHPTGDDALTLGVDLTVPGTTPSANSLVPSDVDRVDGYEVRIDGTPRAGSSSTLAVTVSRHEVPVTTDPYLGARGHLVALRDGDLAYLHVHPLADEADGQVRFTVEVPSPGIYALFFDFAHDGAVHTARFVIDTDEAAPSPAPSGDDASDDHAGDPGHAHD